MSSFLATMVQMSCIVHALMYLNKDRDYYSAGQRTHGFNIVNYIKTTAVNSTTYYIIIHNLCTESSNNIIYFIPQSFAFEIVLDFGHYWTHRLVHTYPFLYRTIHKKHHNDTLINVYTSFSHNISDYLVTNTVPMLLASYMVPMSKYQFTLQFIFKSLVEIGGHSGKIQNSGSFPQCIYLPRFLGIELTNKNHNEHHINPLCNFSKRFSLWDKLFGTFR